jgi:hypothetical protein
LFVVEECIIRNSARYKTFGICLDFNNVESVSISELGKWKILARIDSPYIDEIIQKYYGLVCRVGTLEINRSPSLLR